MQATIYRCAYLEYDFFMANRTPTARLEGGIIHIEGIGRSWCLDHSWNLEDVWDGLTEHDLADERIPYWVELWPSSLALAELLESRRNEINGQVCIDLGCGLGFTAIVGAYLGASVLACDYITDALQAAASNAAHNGFDKTVSPTWLCLDWRTPAIVQGAVHRVWAGDILYEKRAVRPVFEFLDFVLSDKGVAWIAEPGRGIFGFFQELAKEKGWRMQLELKRQIPSLYAEDIPARVTIWQLERQ